MPAQKPWQGFDSPWHLWYQGRVRLARSTQLVLMVTASIGLQSAPVGSEMRFDPCRNVRRCRAAKYDVHSMPSSVTHSPCDANGQAPSGVPDETADLQAWIDSVPDGTGRPRPVLPGRSTDPDQWRVLEFPHGRCIRMDGHLTIRDRHYLIFDGEGVTLDQHLKPATARSTRNGATWN